MSRSGGERVRSALYWTRLDTIALTVITTGAGILRLARVGDPPDVVFDELYYAKDACWYVQASTSACDLDFPPTEVHPPLGKWIIALGIRLFRYDSFGWRISSVLAGTATVALLYLLARLILRSTTGAAIASGLLAIDLLHFVQSRMAMLDIFLPLFAVAGFLFLAYDRERLLRGPPHEKDPHERRTRGGLLNRPWRLAAGAAGGAAFATKWSGAFVFAGIVVLAVVWEVAARKPFGRRAAIVGTIRDEGLSLVACFVVVPLALYVGTYIGRLEGDFLALPWSEGSWLGAFWDHHTYMFDFHSKLDATHSYQSPAWSWLLLKRPVSYFFEGDGGLNREILATGSPFVWWASILALLFVAVSWVRRRDFTRPEGLILLGFAFSYVPWVIPYFSRSAIFIFYLLPAVPFMCLSLGYAATRLGESWEAHAARAVFSVAAVGFFVFYFPLLVKMGISPDAWDARIWAFDNCDAAEGVPTKTTVTTTLGTEVRTVVTNTTTSASLPPPGWCWI